MASLKPIDRSADYFELAQTAWSLSRAARGNRTMMQREHPRAAEEFRSFGSAWRSLGRLSMQSEDKSLITDVICSTYMGGKPLGLANAKLREETDSQFPIMPPLTVELSYWNLRLAEGPAVEVGVNVVRQLSEHAISMFDMDALDTAWMLVLADDEAKQEVCNQTGLQATGPVKEYNVGDGVNQLRLLYRATFGEILET